MAIGIVAYNTGVLDSYLPRDAAEAPAETAGAASGEEVAAVAADRTAADATRAGETQADANVADAAPQADIVAPRFDIVRVEPDGNVIIAGNAAAGAAVEVVTGSRVLGEAVAGAGGDFAVVLSDPLKPGDYTVVLRATSPDKVVAMSAETAIVSIPEASTGEVLAIVDEPGKPSKLITVPEGKNAAAAEGREGVEETTDVAMAGDATAKDADTGDTAAAGEKEAGEAMKADAADKRGGEAVEMASVEPAGDEKADEAVAGSGKGEPVEAKPADELRVAVEAVEIEGDHVFIAGVANPGRIVRVYANKDLVGEATVSQVGRFLVESTRGLPAGDYIIRADLLNVGSADVIARAAVPFEREAGETVAAVAPKVDAETASGENGMADETSENAATRPADAAGKGEAVQADEKSAGGMVASADDDGAEPAGSKTATAPAEGDGKTAEMTTDTGGAAAGPAMTGEAADTDKPAKPGDIEFAKFDEDVALTAPKLEKTSGSVIIRRGDTLWRISRRVYGRGIRYTSIYTANRDQIKNPHRIWPGQVFGVPGVSDDGTTADMDAIADQIAGPQEESRTQ
ncbi:MAG: LysM peptidoglycan-binding domain-containing protein [Rhizobiaceae bacterium]